ncbi:MAG TPA: ATP-binding protein [Candidatus Woesearchaeota archaeon]|nr:ATP-binding protein [Candidatus Woesearchaeota archaeon]
MYDIIIGRLPADKERFGTKGTILLGKHYVKMGRTTSLSNNILLDVIRSHVVFVCGKRGGGKSYTMGVIAEGIASLPPEVKNNIAVIMLDTMGVYWTMKYPNKKDELLLEEWGIEPRGLDITIYTPTGYFSEYKNKGIPADAPFSIKPSELDGSDWCMTFDVNPNEPIGVLVERVIHELRERKEEYDIDDIIQAIMKSNAEDNVKNATLNLFSNAKTWGLFSKAGTPLSELAKPGQVTVLDVSCYATLPGSWRIKSLVIGLVAEKLFIQRMIARKNEEYQQVHKSIYYFSDEEIQKLDFPMVWLIIDEAHEFLPKQGKTLASDPLITILREGRQPGISLVLASQQPGKIHTDVMTQADTIIAHRITAKIDIDALGALMQSYLRGSLDKYLDNLPRMKGAALILDDTNEKMYPMRVRPRFTWHGGEAPTALREKEEIFHEE